MATWAEFEREAPGLAAVAGHLWPGIIRLQRPSDRPRRWEVPIFSIAFLATARPDGAPRLHPVCPILAHGRLYVAIPRSSPKGHDLRRDPRCVIHALPGPDDDELCIRARAREVTTDDDVKESVVEVVQASEVGGMIESVTNDPLFELELEQVDVARWIDIGQPGTQARRLQWQAPVNDVGDEDA